MTIHICKTDSTVCSDCHMLVQFLLFNPELTQKFPIRISPISPLKVISVQNKLACLGQLKKHIYYNPVPILLSPQLNLLWMLTMSIQP